MADPLKPENLLNHCNDNLIFEQLYGYNCKQILKWLKAASESPLEYCSGTESKEQPYQNVDFKNLYGFIENLSCPDGTKYKDQALKKAQHVNRTLHKPITVTVPGLAPVTYPNWAAIPNEPKADPSLVTKTYTSKFLVPIEQTNNFTERNFLIFTVYDALGLFLSALDKSPAMATNANFYLPMLMLYSSWCTELGNVMKKRPGGDPSKAGADGVPVVYQVTWGKPHNTEERARFLIGSSFVGPRTDVPSMGGLWPESVRIVRYKTIEHYLVGSEFNYKLTPESKNRPSIVTSKFGNCGETYPFLYFFDLQYSPQTHECGGFAINHEHLYDKNESIGTLEGAYRQIVVVEPCRNCQFLITHRGWQLSDFDVWLKNPLRDYKPYQEMTDGKKKPLEPIKDDQENPN